MKLKKYHLEPNHQLFYSVFPKNDIIIKDEKGVVLYKIPYTQKHDYYPVYVAEYALGNYNKYIDNENEENKEEFLKHVDWLVENIVDKKNFGVWEHYYTLPYYNFKTPWIHGMAQGLAVSALLRAYELTKEKKYLDTAKKAYNVFNVPLKKGGVRYIDKQKNIWLEEYSVTPPPHILNGYIFALLGVYDFYQFTKQEKALELWNEGIKTLEKKLDDYDLGYWSLYNLAHKHPAPIHYHKIHIKQLNRLYQITKNKLFKKYAEQWDQYLNSWKNRTRVRIKRTLIHLKKHGIKGGFERYLSRKKWQRSK